MITVHVKQCDLGDVVCGMFNSGEIYSCTRAGKNPRLCNASQLEVEESGYTPGNPD